MICKGDKHCNCAYNSSCYFNSKLAKFLHGMSGTDWSRKDLRELAQLVEEGKRHLEED